MKKEKVKIIIIVAAAIIGVGTFGIYANADRIAEARLMAETPLNETVFWHSMDKYPAYKVEAAKMVEQLMAEGTSQEEACRSAITFMSDKVYEDTVRFYAENPGLEGEEKELALAKYIEQTQK